MFYMNKINVRLNQLSYSIINTYVKEFTFILFLEIEFFTLKLIPNIKFHYNN